MPSPWGVPNQRVEAGQSGCEEVRVRPQDPEVRPGGRQFGRRGVSPQVSLRHVTQADAVCKTVISIAPWGEVTAGSLPLVPSCTAHTLLLRPTALRMRSQGDALLVSLCVCAPAHVCVLVCADAFTHRGQRTAWNVPPVCSLLFKVGSLPGLELGQAVENSPCCLLPRAGSTMYSTTPGFLCGF